MLLLRRSRGQHRHGPDLCPAVADENTMPGPQSPSSDKVERKSQEKRKQYGRGTKVLIEECCCSGDGNSLPLRRVQAPGVVGQVENSCRQARPFQGTSLRSRKRIKRSKA